MLERCYIQFFNLVINAQVHLEERYKASDGYRGVDLHALYSRTQPVRAGIVARLSDILSQVMAAMFS
jgi:hypothetical protein